MRQRALAAFLLFVLMVLVACTGASHTCTISGLIKDRIYLYSYTDGDGRTITDAFVAPGETVEFRDVPASVDCGSYQVIGEVELMVDGPVS